MAAEFWLHPADDPRCAAQVAALRASHDALLGEGLELLGGIRTWMPLAPPQRDGLVGAEASVARWLAALAEGEALALWYRHPSSEVLVALSALGDEVELTASSVLDDGAVVRTRRVSAPFATALEGDDDLMFADWREGGLFQRRVEGDAPAVIQAHGELLSEARADRDSLPASLTTLDEALFVQRAADHAGERQGWAAGLTESGIWSEFEAMRGAYAPALVKMDALPGPLRLLLCPGRKMLAATLAWQERTAAAYRAGFEAPADIEALRALPVRAATQPGAVGGFASPPQAIIDRPWWLYPLYPSF